MKHHGQSNFIKRWIMNFFRTLILFLCIVSVVSGQENEFDFLNEWIEYSDAENAFYHHLKHQALEFLDQRENKIAMLEGNFQWQQRQSEIREILGNIVGPFPDKTPLNARITGTIVKERFRVEKIIFESQPGFFVTSALFLPRPLDGKAPAVVFCCGHSDLGFRSEAYQTMILNLVMKGFIVFAFDPVGQGERLQYVDPETGTSLIGGPTKEHSYPGAQGFLTQHTQARIMIWDGIRAVDYMHTRPEVDTSRLGITGRSGGGTQSAYIAAFDERIHAAAPECYMTTFERLWQTRGPQDAEQNFYHGIASGFDLPDLLIVRAPKPALMITTSRDIFSIQGAMETAAQVQMCYDSFGAGYAFDMVTDDAPHANTVRNREAMMAFFQEALNQPGLADDEQVTLFDPQELWVTESGQVQLTLKGKTCFDLIHTTAVSQRQELDKKRQAQKSENFVDQARQLCGYRELIKPLDRIYHGRYEREGYYIERWIISGEGAYPIPFLLLKPDNKGEFPAVLYLHPEGKSMHTGPGQVLEKLVKSGNIVLTPDLVGIGEMGPGRFRGDAYSFKVGTGAYNLWFAGIQIGRSLVGVHASDISRLIDFLTGYEGVDANQISAVALKDLTPALAHAAAFDLRIREIVQIEPLVSFFTLVDHEFYAPEWIQSTVAGALPAYDLPDLYRAILPRDVTLINPLDHLRETASVMMIDQEMGDLRQKSNFDLRQVSSDEVDLILSERFK
ncbi:xylan esterase [candidate division KSB1 bacterium]|nr:xylan esterase [candidate division KSB1 bacterium]